MNRRTFLLSALAASAASGTVRAATPKHAPKKVAAGGKPGRLIVSAPVLQNAAETSMGVSFAVSADASGWVDYAESPNLSDAVRAYSGAGGLMEVNGKVALIRLTSLKPATRYYYRIGADRILYKGGYSMKNLGPETDSAIHSFTTLGATASGSFCVINDTHDRKPILDMVFAKLAELKPAAVIWNGDVSNCTETIDEAVNIFLRPHVNHPAYAADTPYLFVPGNHDFRGRFMRRLGGLMMFREPAERPGEYAELGRNFVQRLGDTALIGLDTGEDKLDTNPRFAGIFQMQPYRERQARWLAHVLETPAVKTAKFKVAFCHIPLFDPRPDQNPGDVAPDDSSPQYSRPWASWQRTCAKLWGPLFEQAGVQLVIAAHQHSFRYDAPAEGRPWAQIVGGGCDIVPGKKRYFPSVIEGRVEGGRLQITVHDVAHSRIVARKTFA
ncbi:MAG: metallophosphoesterase [Kiritimatiellae bacterium]|nr:metallophosphoesterase [Kiritimatiellia bacterium]